MRTHNRVIYLVDGFNLYHSIRDASEQPNSTSMKWLNVSSLCSSYLHRVKDITAQIPELRSIYYFSAVPTHLGSSKQQRHQLFMACLRSTGIIVNLGRFKGKPIECPKCRCVSTRWEEKETDVAIAVKLFEICHRDESDTIILLTGDTDLVPAVKTCRDIFPNKLMLFAFPYKRGNEELKKLAPHSFRIKPKSYIRHQFPDPLQLNNGKTINKPPSW